jgi:hypothetical protein
MRLRNFSILVIIVLSMSHAVLGAADDLAGTFTVDGKNVPFRHIQALLHDNAEGLLSSPTQLRLLITDVEVPIDSLYGLYFLPADDLGRQGKAKVLLLQFDPSNYAEVDMTILLPEGLQTVTNRLKIKDLKMTRDRVSGEFEYADSDAPPFGILRVFKFGFRFSTALNYPPPVTDDLKGRAALNSPQFKALRVFAKTLAIGNFKKLRSLSSERANRKAQEDLARRGTRARKLYIRAGSELLRSAPKVKRIVVRGKFAVAIFPNDSAFNLAFEKGSWKGD